MMRRTPLARTGFTQKKPQKPIGTIEGHSDAAFKLIAEAKPRKAAMTAANDEVCAVPKRYRQINPYLLGMANGRPCLLRVPDVCNGRTDTTVACHSNYTARGGKGGARKADDQYTVWGCYACHTWLDQGPASAEEKEQAFARAHAAQIEAWRAIDTDPATWHRDRLAVRWALNLLKESKV